MAASQTDDLQQLDAAISQRRLLELLARLATFGAIDGGGVNRQALSKADIRAKEFLVGYARSLGCTCSMDAAGNLFFRRPGRGPDAPAVSTGSHVDTQPAGGELDGAFGVCAGLEVMAAMNAAGVITRHPIEVIAWSNEEGCRFPPGSLGAKAFVEPTLLPVLLDARDDTGVRYGDGVAELRARLTDVQSRALAHPMRLFIETHIEQGPVLEQAAMAIGIVTGVQGTRWFRITTKGEAAHAGTTPSAQRRDALRASVDLMARLYAFADATPDLRLTIGKLEIASPSINTVPGEVTFTVDVRHVAPTALDACELLLRDACSAACHGCSVTCERTMALAMTPFDEDILSVLRTCSRELDIESMDMMSGAFHDAVELARHCPTGMVFVPSHLGISHNPREHTDPALLTTGVRVLARSMATLAEVDRP